MCFLTGAHNIMLHWQMYRKSINFNLGMIQTDVSHAVWSTYKGLFTSERQPHSSRSLEPLTIRM